MVRVCFCSSFFLPLPRDRPVTSDFVQPVILVISCTCSIIGPYTRYERIRFARTKRELGRGELGSIEGALYRLNGRQQHLDVIAIRHPNHVDWNQLVAVCCAIAIRLAQNQRELKLKATRRFLWITWITWITSFPLPVPLLVVSRPQGGTLGVQPGLSLGTVGS